MMLTSNKVRGGLAPWRAKRVADYIESNIARSFSIADLADMVHLSIGHFFRKFRQSFGQSPLVYINARRIHRAKVLMLSTADPLTQIALECGMCDQAHFSRLFRKTVGMTPSLWRRQFQSAVTCVDPMLRPSLPRSSARRVTPPEC